MAAPEPGTTLAGKYVIERVLGVGGMGVVVAARHIDLDQRVAIKYLLPETLANPEIVERFAREARAAAKIKGEHVARVLDVGRFDDGAPFMVLEYLEGEDLSQLLERSGPLPIADAVGHVLEACEALAEAHAAGVVHRDLKPANLFLARRPDRRSIVKVLDFGISKVVDPSGHALTSTATVMGTPHYMSPEQLKASKHVDARSDIWALGVILFELLSNRKPFVGDTLAEIIGAILTNEPERLSSLRADVSLDLELAIARCLRDKAEERHASVKELAVALAPFASLAQQETVEKIARVLGASLRPSASGESALVDPGSAPMLAAPAAPSSGFDQTAIVVAQQEAPSVPSADSTKLGAAAPVPAPSPPMRAPDTAPAVSAVVRAAPPPARRPWLVALVALVVLGAGALGLAAARRTKPVAEPQIAPLANVGVASATAPSGSVVGTASPLPTTVAATASPEPVAPAPSAASSTRGAAPSPPLPRVTVRGATSAASVASTSTPVTAPSKNPLQMGLK